MNRIDTARQIAETMENLTIAQVSSVVDAFLTHVKNKAKSGEAVVVKGFGTFRVRKAKARKAQDVHRGKTIEVAAKKRISFKAAKDFLND